MLTIITTILSMLHFAVITITITFLINIIFVKDFRILLKQIKKVVSSDQANKTTQIKNIIYNYLF